MDRRLRNKKSECDVNLSGSIQLVLSLVVSPLSY